MFDLIRYNFKIFAGVVELVDTLDLGSSAARRESSSLSARTIVEFGCNPLEEEGVLFALVCPPKERWTGR